MEPLTPAPVVLDPAIIDEYGLVCTRLEPLAARKKRLKEKLDACIPAELAASDKWTFNGQAYVIGVGPCEWERTIKSLRALYRKIGHKAFFDRCKFNLKDFDELVLEGERPAFVTREQTGPRKFTVVQKYTSAS